MSTRTLRNAAIWSLAAAAIGLWMGQSIPTYQRLYKRGMSADAIVTGYEPANHRTVHYKFVVNGREYFGWHWGRPANIGDRIPITYLPEQPTVSCPDSAKAWLDNELTSAGLAVLVMSPFIVGVIDMRLRKRRSA
jgi:hypothetical protein